MTGLMLDGTGFQVLAGGVLAGSRRPATNGDVDLLLAGASTPLVFLAADALVLFAAGQPDEARSVLYTSLWAANKVGMTDLAKDIDGLLSEGLR